jgi:hypothetical protein
MLTLNEKDFMRLLRSRNKRGRSKLIKEMLDHEEQTRSFCRSKVNKKLTKDDTFFLCFFNKNENSYLVKLFKSIKKILKKGGQKVIDLNEAAIMSKAISDYNSIHDEPVRIKSAKYIAGLLLWE